MYNCYTHGWASLVNVCPDCFPVHVTTSTSTTYTDSIMGINKSKLDQLRAENARYKEALMKISVPDPVQYDGVLAFNYKLIAREALKGND